MKTIRVWRWVMLVVLALSLMGCASRRATPLESADYGAPVQATMVVEREVLAARAEPGYQGGDEGAALPDSSEVERLIIYNVYLELIVKDTEAALAEVQLLTQQMGGFISESNLWRDEGHPRGTVTVRVPADRLDEALEKLRALALDVDSERRDSQDVTEEYVDLGARLKNEQRTEAELQELLETRSEIGKTEDILEVHRELGQVRSRIEQIQGRMNYLEKLSAMATVQISLTPDELQQPIVVAGWTPRGTARSAIRALLRTAQFLADALIVFMLYILPTLVLIAIPLALLFLLGRAIWRRIRRRGRKAKQQGA